MACNTCSSQIFASSTFPLKIASERHQAPAVTISANNAKACCTPATGGESLQRRKRCGLLDGWLAWFLAINEELDGGGETSTPWRMKRKPSTLTPEQAATAAQRKRRN
jgi:hypothetical protein